MIKLLRILLIVLLAMLLVGCEYPENTRIITGEVIAINFSQWSLSGDSTHIFLADGTHIWAPYPISLQVGETYTFTVEGRQTSSKYYLLKVAKPQEVD